MKRHRKKISILTLTVFILLSVFSGAGTALAAKTPVDKPSVVKPSSMNSGSGGGADLSGDQAIGNVGGFTAPHLDDLKVIWGSGPSNRVDLINSDNSSQCFATTHSATVPASVNTVDVTFVPHKNDWSEWWLGPADPLPSERNRNYNSGNITISDIDLQDGDNIVTIRVGNSSFDWFWGWWYDHDILTVTLTITKPASTVPVTSVSLNKSTLDLVVGGSGSLAATIDPSDATNKNVTWSADPAGVVTLTGSGLTRTVNAGTSPGTTTVTVKTEDGQKTDTCTVTVWDLSLDKTYLEMTAEGNTRTLTATTYPNSKTVSWESSNTNVATVEGGVVTAKNKGIATITASIDVDGVKIEKTCTVEVRNPLKLFVVDEPELNPDGTYTAIFGYTSEYTGDIVADDNQLTNATANPSLPAAFSNGTNNNAFTATYLHSKPAVWEVTYDGITSKVTAGTEQYPQISLDKTSLDLIVNGASKEITATISRPAKAMMAMGDPSSDIVWSIQSGSEYVSISSSGRTCTVTPKSVNGTAVIKATFAGGVSTTCTVTVWDLSLDKTYLEMTAEGNTRTLTATTYPNSKTVSWESSNTNVATVEGGVVTAKNKGIATITASIDVDGVKIEKTCTVEVRNPLKLFVVDEPELNPDGTYTAIFGYTSEYTGDIVADDNQLTNATANPSLPAAFSNGTNNNAFTATYLHSKPAVWEVTYDGITSKVTAGTEQYPQISLDKTSLDLIVNGASKEITATISRPAKAMMAMGDPSSDIVWSIQSGSEYVSISSSGRTCTVTPKSVNGTAVIKATFAGGVSTTCNVTVWDLSLTRPTGFFLTAGGNKKSLVAWQFPTNNYWPIKWESYNEEVAEIDEDTGLITPKKAGTTTIKATINVDGEELYMADGLKVYDPIEVFVSDPVLNDDGTYTATFGYTNHYEWDITIPWGFDNSLINGGLVFPPTTFKKGTVENAFTVTYLHSKPAMWSVKYDGVKDVAKAGKLPNDEIGISVIPEYLQLTAWGESSDLTAMVEEIEAIPEFFGPKSDITWRVEQNSNVIKDYWHRGQTFTVYPHDPGTAYVTAYFANGDSATCEVEVVDPRTISVSPQSLSLRTRGNSGQLVARIENDPRLRDVEARIAECFYPDQYNWGIEWYTEQTDLVELVPGEGGTCAVVPLKSGRAVVTARLANGESASASVRIRSLNRQQESEPVTSSITPPPPPAPPALESLDVTLTIGNQVALVNGEEVTLAGNPLLIGADRAMVDFADMAKLIPGLEVVWDWQTLSVTFSKDDKELKMVLDEIPADFDVPFMNIGGRLVIPVRYVGAFFGATVDWIGDTLVVHMYK